MYLKSSCIFITIFFIATCDSFAQSPEPSENEKAYPTDIEVNWRVQSNYLDGGTRSRSVLTLVNRGDTELKDLGWTLYFNFLRMIIPESLPPDVAITHVNGNLFKMQPTKQFEPLPAGRQLVIPFESQGPLIKKVDAPGGFYFVFGKEKIVPVTDVNVGAFSQEQQTDRATNDNIPLPTAVLQYQKNTFLNRLPTNSIGQIIPTPLKEERSHGEFVLDASVGIRYQQGLKKEALFLSRTLSNLLGAELAVEKGSSRANAILLKLGSVEGYESEAYKINIDDQKIEIIGTDLPGVFYGIQSLRTLLPIDAHRESASSVKVDGIRVKDAPRFSYRGLHLDVARNFQPAPAVKKLIDVMALYKLNTFHFHLTDDEGWRLAIEELPELTSVGGRRGHTETEENHLIPSYGSGPNPDPQISPGSGWYSRETFIDILKYAHRRHVSVIPEINVPGHARAAIVAMKARYEKYMAEGNPDKANQYLLHEPEDESQYSSVQNWDDNVVNICQPSTYRFMHTVVDEIIDMYDEAGVPLEKIHVGGDEVPHGAWQKSPACEQLIRRSETVNSVDELSDHFFRRLNKMLSKHDLEMAGWEEVALDETVKGKPVPDPEFSDIVQPYVWANIWGSGTGDNAYKLANAGYQIVMSQASNFYFDLAYNKHPAEPGLYWAGFVDIRDPYDFIPYDLYKNAKNDLMGNPISDTAYAGATRLTEKGRGNILGLQGQLWGETLVSQDRMEYMALPRLLSLAERAWAEQPAWATIESSRKRRKRMNKEWNDFANRLGQRELPRLDYLNGGYNYRLPPPGATVKNGMMKANVAFPGLTIRYTLDGSKPTVKSNEYTQPVAVSATPVIKLRTFNTTGRGSRTVTIGEE